MRRSLQVRCQVQVGLFRRLPGHHVRSPANQFRLHLVAQVVRATRHQGDLVERAAVGTAVGHLVVVDQRVPVADHVRFPAPEHLPQVAVAVVPVAVVPVAQQVDVLRSGRDVVVATAKNFSR